jgi:hypothetical protein
MSSKTALQKEKKHYGTRFWWLASAELLILAFQQGICCRSGRVADLVVLGWTAIFCQVGDAGGDHQVSTRWDSCETETCGCANQGAQKLSDRGSNSQPHGCTLILASHYTIML